MNTPPSAPVPNLPRLLAQYEILEDGNTLFDPRNCGREDRPAQGFVVLVAEAIPDDDIDDNGEPYRDAQGERIH